ncbi:MAG: repeat-associated core domain protein containing protein [Pseudomonas sp.]|jgi:insecticidal toxin complex protein TccC|uniref:RHS repeat domain-containing protein n=1 Tax=Pseudomonas sp. TaxID=306 RepID=UPI0026276DAF|nr:RHS repeat-associated core domain-containing protein [Pseudomonas sp.]MDB6048582.1 repeat-associated core domain protein containing protein [Pseudomonas sp.]
MDEHTPLLAVHDPRGLAVRTVQFWRRAHDEPSHALITQQRYDTAGRGIQVRDPRLFNLTLTEGEAVPFTLSQQLSLSGSVLLTESVDAGWRITLSGETGQATEGWDGLGTHTVIEYDTLLRPVTLCEQATHSVMRVIERCTYADFDAAAAAHNRCGQLIRHDDTAGTGWFHEFSIGGVLLHQERRFLQGLSSPDWPVAEVERDGWLEAAPGAVTVACINALGEPLGQVDAMGNTQHFNTTVAGELKSICLQLMGQEEQQLVGDIHYDAFGNAETEVAGNGVVTNRYYDPVSHQLQRLTARKSDNTLLQDLNYGYDPVGNILRIEDAAQATKYFRNQAIVPVNTYVYDTLYQLIEATGREALSASVGPDRPDFQSPGTDPGWMANYTQRYSYDAAGNMQTLTHVGGQNYTRETVTARYSNRSLPVVGGHRPDEAELCAGFDANGNLRALQPGQALEWDLRNQLRQVTPVIRDSGSDDYERYVYDGGGQRALKIRVTQAASVTHRAEVRYLPGLEIRTDTATGETLHVISGSGCRVLHWQEGKPAQVANDQLRYSLSDHLGSSTLEVDQQGELISQEGYYPFGGTAWWAGRSAVEADYKTIRYSGKELDATGLYYYGFRYYAPWLARWINPDPAGVVEGLNVYAMVGNQPVNRFDADGLAPVELNDALKSLAERTAVELFRSGDALNPFMRQEAFSKAQRWMRDEIVKMGLSRRKYGETIWKYGLTEFIPREEELAKDRVGMTDNQKQGLHLFWSTNAGARYINTATRSYVTGQGASVHSFDNASNEAFRELSSNNGEATIKLSASRRRLMFDPAIALLKKQRDYPAGTARLFIASLGKTMRGELYRGARVDDLDKFKAGAELTTSGFTSFSTDESEAKKFTGGIFHEVEFVNRTHPVLFILQGGAREITSLDEVEGVVEPQKKFVVSSTRREGRHLNVFINARKTGGTGVWI